MENPWITYAFCLTITLCLMHLGSLLQTLSESSSRTTINSRKRKKDSELSYHRKRKRISWPTLTQELGGSEFKRHHRISLGVFNKVYDGIKVHIRTQKKYARKSCCRGETSHVDGRSRLSMLCKHLAGSKTQDIERTHGVSRSTVVQSISMAMDAIIEEFGIPPFPFDDKDELQKIADGFREKSTGTFESR